MDTLVFILISWFAIKMNVYVAQSGGDMYKPFANFLWIPSDQISSRPHTTDFPQNVAFWKGNPLISGKSRLVKYSIWPDSFSWHSKGRVWDGFPPPHKIRKCWMDSKIQPFPIGTAYRESFPTTFSKRSPTFLRQLLRMFCYFFRNLPSHISSLKLTWDKCLG